MPRALKYIFIGIHLLLVLINASAACGFAVEKNDISLSTLKSTAEPHASSSVSSGPFDYRNSLSLIPGFFDDYVNDCSQLAGFSLGEHIKSDPELPLLHCKGGSRMRRNLLGEDLLLHQPSSPTIGEDGLVYTCIGRSAYAFNMDGTVAWTIGLNDTCERLLPPAVTNDGKVYMAANHRVIVTTYSQELNLLSVWDLFDGTSLDGSMLGSKQITGLTLMGNGTSILINAGIAGLYAVAEDGSPLWSTSGDFNSTDAMFPSGTFCSDLDKFCYFHFSPAVDHCDGSIYLIDSDSTYEWLVICN